jgi:hypothetical protein
MEFTRQPRRISPPAAYIRHQLLAGIGVLTSSSPVLYKYMTGRTPTGGKLPLSQATEFLGSDLEKIQRRGVIVLLPAWWTDRSYKSRIELHTRWNEPDYRQGILGIDEILSFDYRVAI